MQYKCNLHKGLFYNCTATSFSINLLHFHIYKKDLLSHFFNLPTVPQQYVDSIVINTALDEDVKKTL